MYPVLSSDVILHKQFGGSIVFKKRNTQMAVSRINKSAAEILELCDGSRSTTEISRIMATKYADEFGRVKSLVSNFLNEAVQKGHIVFNVNRMRSDINVTGDYDLVIPLHISIEVTNACPLRCEHCYKDSGNSLGKELSLKELIKIIDILSHAGVRRAFITGGEPLMRHDLIDFLKYASQRLDAIILATNGYLVTKRTARSIAMMKNIVIQISLDGTEEVHNQFRRRDDAYQRTVNSISLFSSEGLYVIVAMTVTPYTQFYMEEVAKVAKERGAKEVRFGLVMPLGSAEGKALQLTPREVFALRSKIAEIKKKYERRDYQNRDEYFVVGGLDLGSVDGVSLQAAQSQYDERASSVLFKGQSNCGAGHLSFNILPNGDVTPCTTISSLKFGNIAKDKLRKIFGSSKALVFKKLQAPSPEICKDCESLYLCRGCIGMAFATGSKERCRWLEYFQQELNRA